MKKLWGMKVNKNNYYTLNAKAKEKQENCVLNCSHITLDGFFYVCSLGLNFNDCREFKKKVITTTF